MNRRDLMLIDGTYPLPATADVIPLSDGVGEVIALGPAVTRGGAGPSAITSPTPSESGMTPAVAGNGYVPSISIRSRRFTEAARTLIRT